MRPTSTLSETDSESTMSSAFSDDDEHYDTRPVNANNNNNPNTSSSQQFFAKLVRDTRSKVEQKTSEINATMQEKLPEWKLRGAMYSNKAKETSIEWSRRGKEAVDRWKKDRADEDAPYNPAYRQQHSQSSENAVFGMPLEVAVALTKIDADDLIPAVFRRCIEYLNDVGVHEVGIYRIPGSTITVNKLRAVFDDGSDIDFDVTRPDPHAVGTLLKMYLRELPEPIIPFELANEYTKQFMKSIQSSNEGDKKAMEDTIDVTTSLSTAETSKLPPISPALLKTVRSITSRLPIYSFCLLQLLCRHLKRVADKEEENRMSVSNLALIFIPTLNIGRALFHCMVEHYCEIFEGDSKNKPAGPAGITSRVNKGTAIIPPPLPQKPRNLSIDQKGNISSGSSNSSTKSSTISLTGNDISNTVSNKKKIFHSKTMSDTDLIMNNTTTSSPSSPVSLSPSSTLSPTTNSRVPPPKPSRSPLQPNNASSTSFQPQQPQRQQSEHQQYISGNSNPLLPRPRVPVKPRSKSVSSPVYRANINISSSSSSSHNNNNNNNNSNNSSNDNDNEDEILWKRSGRVEAIGRQFETLMNNKNTCPK